MRRSRQFGGRRHTDDVVPKGRKPECRKCEHFRPKTSKENAYCVNKNIYNPKVCGDFHYLWGWWWRNDEHKRNN